MSFVAVQEVIEGLGRIDIIYIGGCWCSYTKQAKDYCIVNNIGFTLMKK